MLKTIFIAIAVLIVGLFVVNYTLLTDKKIETPAGTDPGSFNGGSDWGIPESLPELPEGYEWTEVEITEDGMRDVSIFAFPRMGKSELSELVTIEPPGKKFATTITVADNQDLISAQEILNSMVKQLVETGWTYRIEYGDYDITATAADGVTGSLWGVIKINGDFFIRTVAFSYNYEGNWIDSPDARFLLECPCEISMFVFISEPVDLRDYISDL